MYRCRSDSLVDESEVFWAPGTDGTRIVGSSATRIGLQMPERTGLSGPPYTQSSAGVLAAVTKPKLRPGMRLGPYRLLRRLGQGAQGDVWKARRQDPRGEIVALKVLSPAMAKLPSRLAQFRREAERGALLDGPSLLRVFEFGEAQGFLYMAMPFVRGTSLLDVIRGRQCFLRGEPVKPGHRLVAVDEETYLWISARILATAACALARIHSRRVVHRDIKPANILLDGDPSFRVYVCDLGLGRDLEVATPEQMRDGAGTPMYMAPEKLLRAQADEILCDLYAMGVTLFETFTLAQPFQPPAGIPSNLLTCYLASAHPQRPGKFNPAIPAELEAITLKAMSRNPRDRHQSALELVRELNQFLLWRKDRAALPAGPHAGAETPRAFVASAVSSRCRPLGDGSEADTLVLPHRGRVSAPVEE
jgi:serine/threonine-protein kinase